ncbi:MAG: hypothetical protein ACLFU2_11205, partial [Opitutales bacterium]
MMQWRKMMVFRFCKPAFRAFLEALEASGKWAPKGGRTIDDYVRDVDWIGEPPVHIHPKQEAETDILLIENCI